MECKVKVKNPETLEIYYGTSLDLSVTGISFESEYVPRYGEILEVHVMPPQVPAVPLSAKIQVRWCTQVVAGNRYEIGGAFRQILQ
jgi:hypothetical protein